METQVKIIRGVGHHYAQVTVDGRDRAHYELDGSLGGYTMPRPDSRTLRRWCRLVKVEAAALAAVDHAIAMQTLPRKGSYAVVWYYQTDHDGRDWAAGEGQANYQTVSTHSDRDEALDAARHLLHSSSPMGHYSDVSIHLGGMPVVETRKGRLGNLLILFRA